MKTIKNMIKILAFAKLNLCLHVTGKLPDGYHTLQTVMQTISLPDELCITPNDCRNIEFDCNSPELNKQDNLVIKAYNLFTNVTGCTNGYNIHLEKRIPTAAGLGGGSADAAATLCALNQLNGMPLSVSGMEKISLQLGSDVPFFIKGGCSLAEGKGEILKPMVKRRQYFYVLVKTGKKTSTGEMYAALDRLPVNANSQCIDYQELVNDIAYLHSFSQNDFTVVSPISKQVQDDFLKAGALRVLLSGSGPTCFSVFDDEITASAVYEQLKNKYPMCFLVSDVNSGNRVI